MRKILIIIFGLLLVLSASGQAVFDQYLANAKAFNEAFPREKVHLHFDNISYYQGDTIWFKAYVVTVSDNKLSHISKPLYVELLDQMGNVVEKQIVKLTDGMGHGQFSLNNMYFTGYFEVRAYTKWMLAFDDDTYFSRTFPIYRKPISGEARSIAEYHMDSSMKQRPQDKSKSSLDVRFYPESGTLIKGIPSTVGIEALSKDSGWVNIEGVLVDAEGKQLLPVSTIHDGMGSFVYTPDDQPAAVEFEYQGKKYSFKLPQAEAEGFSLRTNVRADNIDITLSRSQNMTPAPLALFVFVQGVPINYVSVDLSSATSQRIKIMTADLPAGVVRLALITETGKTLCDRFCFNQPKDVLSMKADANGVVYPAYGEVEYTLKVTDSEGKPMVAAPVSVAVRNGMESDWRFGDSDIMTDLLLTSELKGYINRPEFYFNSTIASTRKMLDNLMLIRGWRHYDISQAFGTEEFVPRYLPEDNLMLYGKVKSYFQKSGGLALSVLAQNDSIYVSGVTQTDSLGEFSIPLDDFEGRLEALIQTRKDGKKMNRASSVILDRRFQPELRMLDYLETRPAWDAVDDSTKITKLLDDIDPYKNDDEKVLIIDEVVVKAKNRKKYSLKDTQAFERTILAYYNMRQLVDDMRDQGKIITDDIGNLLHEINPVIDVNGEHYGASNIEYSIEGRTLEKKYLDGTIDEMEHAVIYSDQTSVRTFRFKENGRTEEVEASDYFTGQNANYTAETDVFNRKMKVRVDFTMQERFDIDKSYTPVRGVRRTIIQGYNKPCEFYSPQYPTPESTTYAFEDQRRTLFWSPEMQTDDNGMLRIKCYNSTSPSYVTISAESIVDGKPAAINDTSIRRQ